jgi:hypothetical protein
MHTCQLEYWRAGAYVAVFHQDLTQYLREEHTIVLESETYYSKEREDCHWVYELRQYVRTW